MKQNNAIQLAVLFTFLLFTCFAQGAELTVYSFRHYESDTQLFKRFTKETGIVVHLVKSKADTLLERLKAEGSKTRADVLITSDAGRLHKARAAGLLQPVQSEQLNSRIPVHLRDPEGHWYGFTLRARVLVYAKDRVSPEDLDSYESLSDEKWRGRVLARSSSNIYNQSLLASIIASNGEKSAFEWAKSLRSNMARSPQGSDRDQMRAVAAGLADVAIVNTYYLGLLQNSESAKDRAVAGKLAVFFPNQDSRGTHVNVSGAGIVKHSDNVAGATQLLEFLASDAAQAVFPEATYEYPVVDSVEWSTSQKQWGDFKSDSINLSKLGILNALAIRTFNTAKWE